MKRFVLALALIATLVAVYFAPPAQENAVVATAKPRTGAIQQVRLSSTSGAAAMPRPAALQIRPRQGDDDLGNVFASHTWTPPKPVEKPVPPAAAPAPEAPPLPFRFLGRWIDGDKVIYFLQSGERNLAVTVGETIDNTYTLDNISSGALTFTYLPLQQKQTLAVGEVN